MLWSKQIFEVAHLVKPVLTVIHPGFHQNSRYPVLHLHSLPDHQVPVAQSTAPIPKEAQPFASP
jgi:hypothetical protein